MNRLINEDIELFIFDLKNGHCKKNCENMYILHIKCPMDHKWFLNLIFAMPAPLDNFFLGFWELLIFGIFGIFGIFSKKKNSLEVRNVWKVGLYEKLDMYSSSSSKDDYNVYTIFNCTNCLDARNQQIQKRVLTFFELFYEIILYDPLDLDRLFEIGFKHKNRNLPCLNDISCLLYTSPSPRD